jgi:hypothetical protein
MGECFKNEEKYRHDLHESTENWPWPWTRNTPAAPVVVSLLSNPVRIDGGSSFEK